MESKGSLRLSGSNVARKNELNTIMKYHRPQFDTEKNRKNIVH